MPATAISFKKDTLDLLRQIADREQRSLAAQVRVAVESWLQSPEGLAAVRKSGEPPRLGADALRTAQSAPPVGDEDKERMFAELQELMRKLLEK